MGQSETSGSSKACRSSRRGGSLMRARVGPACGTKGSLPWPPGTDRAGRGRLVPKGTQLTHRSITVAAHALTYAKLSIETRGRETRRRRPSLLHHHSRRSTVKDRCLPGLRLRYSEPNCCALEESRDELAPLHSMTSSARASSDGGRVRPKVFAVCKLITNSNRVGCSTGRSAGFAPRRILSTNSAARRY
jgi:hypothetical protein